MTRDNKGICFWSGKLPESAYKAINLTSLHFVYIAHSTQHSRLPSPRRVPCAHPVWYKAMLVELKKRAPLQYDTPYGPVSF